jgi:hypothetical protein
MRTRRGFCCSNTNKRPSSQEPRKKKEATTGKIILGTHFILLGAREEEAAGRSVRGGSFHLPQARAAERKKETKTPTLPAEVNN